MIIFAAGGGPATFDPLAVNPGLIIWTLIIFVTVVLVLRFAAWGPLIKALDARADKIKGDLDAAAKERADAEELLAQRKAELDKQLSEAQAIIAEGKKDAEVLRDDIIAKANADANDIKDRALREIEQAKTKVIAEVQETAINLATELAGKLIGEKVDSETHKAYLKKAVDEYQNLN